MRIAVIQQIPGHSYNYLKSAPKLSFLKEKAEERISRSLEFIDMAAKENADIAVTTEAINVSLPFPDTRYPFSTVYEGLDGPTVKRFSDAAKKHGMHIAAGLYLTIEEKTYNCAVLFDDCGKIVGIHKKVHLPAGEEIQVTPGEKFEVFHTRLGNIGMLVCWDMQFPEAARELALGGADIILCPTLGWENIYGRCRAYENSITIAVAMGMAESGVYSCCDPACIVDNMGNILSVAPRDKETVVFADVDIKKEPLPQYGSERFYPSHSMRKTRFSQRKPHTYRLTSSPTEELPLFFRYFGDGKED